MEAYRSRCPDCGRTYNWTGYKTGLGKTPEQLQKMHDDSHICKFCKSPNLNTGLDTDSEVGQAYGMGAQVVAHLIGTMLNGGDTESAMKTFVPKVTEVNVKALPLGEPIKVNGEWFYKTRHKVWILRLADDTTMPPTEAAKLPVWVYYSEA